MPENEQNEAIDELIIKHEQHTYQKKVKRKNRKMNTQLLQHYDMGCNGNGMNQLIPTTLVAIPIIGVFSLVQIPITK